MQKKYPFKFLDAYTREDADIFFGREAEVDALYEMVFQTDLLLVYGASGTGKTSLIQCGLASKFQSHDWLALNIRRGSDLNEALEKALVQAGGTFSAEIKDCPAASSIESEPFIPTAKVAAEKDFDKNQSLVKVYPNPLQYSTNITLNLPKASPIQLDLHDINGRKIASIVNSSQLSAGLHQFQWSSDQVEAGMYFVVLNGQVTERLVVLK